jgi:uncharacterized protein
MGLMMSETERWEPYARAWRRRLAAEETAHRRAAESARAAARRCAEILLDRFAAHRVYLFGSLTGQAAAPFGPHSDIDLAVEGLAAESYWAALGALDPELPPGTHLDLVRLEDASPSLVTRIHQSGEVLGERG